MAEVKTNEVITEETIDVLADSAKEQLTTGGKIVGFLTAAGATAIIIVGVLGSKWAIGKFKNRKAAKAEPLADEDFAEDFEEVTKDDEES